MSRPRAVLAALKNTGATPGSTMMTRNSLEVSDDWLGFFGARDGLQPRYGREGSARTGERARPYARRCRTRSSAAEPRAHPSGRRLDSGHHRTRSAVGREHRADEGRPLSSAAGVPFLLRATAGSRRAGHGFGRDRVGRRHDPHEQSRRVGGHRDQGHDLRSA